MSIKTELQKMRDNMLYLYTTPDDVGRRTRRGAMYALAGTIAVAGGVTLATMPNSAPKADTYDSIQVSYKTAMSQLKDAKAQGQDVTLILHRTGCKACESVESLVSKRVHKLSEKENSDTKYITIDLTTLSESQTNELIKMIPSATMNGQIPSPEIVDLKAGIDGDYIVTDKAVGTDTDKIKSVLD
jgi:hypothetical protein